MAKIIVYQHSKFRGDSLTINGDLVNLGPIEGGKFNDTISSVEVASGAWKLYQHANGGGRVSRVHEKGGPDKDGKYPDVASWTIGDDDVKNDEISSVYKMAIDDLPPNVK